MTTSAGCRGGATALLNTKQHCFRRMIQPQQPQQPRQPGRSLLARWSDPDMGPRGPAARTPNSPSKKVLSEHRTGRGRQAETNCAGAVRSRSLSASSTSTSIESRVFWDALLRRSSLGGEVGGGATFPGHPAARIGERTRSWSCGLDRESEDGGGGRRHKNWDENRGGGGGGGGENGEKPWEAKALGRGASAVSLLLGAVIVSRAKEEARKKGDCASGEDRNNNDSKCASGDLFDDKGGFKLKLNCKGIRLEREEEVVQVPEEVNEVKLEEETVDETVPESAKNGEEREFPENESVEIHLERLALQENNSENPSQLPPLSSSSPHIKIELVSHRHTLKAEQHAIEDDRRFHENLSDVKDTEFLSSEEEGASKNAIQNNTEKSAAKAAAKGAAESNNGNKKSKKSKEKVGFRERKIIDYENRIRNYSTPDKIFRYFATYKSIHSDGEVFMTPGDFLRSLTPGAMQPEGLGLDQFHKFDPHVGVSRLDEDLPVDSIFYHLGSRGLISFSDYIFLLTILSTSRRQFEIAFRMFDLNGDGDVDAEEFEHVQGIIRQTTTNGKKHRELHSHAGKMNSALANYFFGERMEGKLTIERFLEFQTQLQGAILALEFARKDPGDDGRITERQLAELLLAYADYAPKKRAAVLKRVRKAYKAIGNGAGTGDDVPSFPGISLHDYEQIFHVLMHIEDVDKALCFHHLAGASIDRRTLQHVAKVCAGVDLADHVVEVLFTIFDEDGNGGLSNKEFVAVMKNKLKRGLEKPKDTGLFNFFAAITKCAITTPL